MQRISILMPCIDGLAFPSIAHRKALLEHLRPNTHVAVSGGWLTELAASSAVEDTAASGSGSSSSSPSRVARGRICKRHINSRKHLLKHNLQALPDHCHLGDISETFSIGRHPGKGPTLMFG